MKEGFQHVTAECWRSLVRHVEEKVEDHYWQHDGLYEEQVDEFIIQVGGEDDDSLMKTALMKTATPTVLSVASSLWIHRAGLRKHCTALWCHFNQIL